MAHLLAASELPQRGEVTSLALGAPKLPRRSVPLLWIDGLERLTSLTHLDLYLSADDEGVDLRGLQRFPSLTHLRMFGPGLPRPLPALENLESLDALRFELEPDAVFPALRSIRGRSLTHESLRPARFPNLVDIEAKGGMKIEGFSSLGKVMCQGDIELHGCERIDRLQVIRGSFNGPDLRHVGELVGVGPGFDVSQLETLGAIQFSRTTKFVGGTFPPGTRLLHPKISFWGPTLTDLGNVGELPGLETLHLVRVKAPISLDTLRHARSLRVLDIRNSPGITDLSPLIGLPKLETIIMREIDELDIPAELADKVEKVGPRSAVRAKRRAAKGKA